MMIELPDLIDELVGINTYAALDYWKKCKEQGIKPSKTTEYTLTLLKLWERLDKLSIPTLESILVELDGKILKGEKNQAKYRRLRTELMDYLDAREMDLCL